MIDKNNYFLSSEGVNDEIATIIKLFFSSGDKVNIGDLIYSFETTKAVVDVEALSDGFIQYFVLEGDEIDIGSLVCKISVKKKKIVDNLKKRSKEQSNIKPTKKNLVIIHRETNTQENFNDALKILATKKYGRSKITFGVF